MYIRRKNKIIKISSKKEAGKRKIFESKTEASKYLIEKQISHIVNTCKNDLVGKMANTYTYISQLPENERKKFIKQLDSVGVLRYKRKGRRLLKKTPNKARNKQNKCNV